MTARLLDYDGAAEYLGVTRTRLEGWVKRRRIAFVKPGGRGSVVLFDIRDLDRWIETHRVPAGSTP